MSEIRAIVFDYFGVICTDQYEVWLRQNKIKRTGQYQKLSQKTDSGGLSMGEFFLRLSTLSGVPAEHIESDFLSNTDIDHRLVDFILRLKKYYQIGLLSNSSLYWINIALNKYHLRAVFDEVVVSGEVGFIKPQAQIYEIMLDRLAILAKEVIFIDDQKVNIVAAEKLGITSVLYNGIKDLEHQLKKLGVVYE